jgi:nitrogen-specific signal transduction histidine kinase
MKIFHDIRNSLCIIIGNAEILLLEIFDKNNRDRIELIIQKAKEVRKALSQKDKKDTDLNN